MKKKGFTLIELIAVLVIMAIIALIVTPLVMSIIKKAKVSADKRSIDAYGRSIELAIAGYLLDSGTFPTNISQLTIEYSGAEVVCSTTQLNSDSSIYLTGCTVDGRSVDYTYGKYETPTYDTYSVGDEVSYNNVDYYVIKDSDASESNVTLLKAEPLTVEEITTYSEGTGAQIYNNTSYGGYGGIQYGTTSAYLQSYVKHVVDAWAQANASSGLQDARLINFDDLLDNLGYENNFYCTGDCLYQGGLDNVPLFVYSNNYFYWIMTANNDSDSNVWVINPNGTLGGMSVSKYRDEGTFKSFAVRPVIVLSKSVISS